MTPLLPPQPSADPIDYTNICETIIQFNDEYDVFRDVIKLDNLIDDILIPQSILCAQQNGESFFIDQDEMKAFLGICYLMGIHKLPEFRDYWSSNEYLGVL